MRRAAKILRDACAVVLASALAFVPLAAVHACAGAGVAEAHPLAATGDAAGGHPAADAEAASASSSAAAAEALSQDSGVDAASLPHYYLANGDFITSVKLQNPWGACWAFAIASALESSILEAQAKLDGTYAARVQAAADAAAPKLTGLGAAVDVSERAIAWLAHELQTEESAGDQAGEGLYRVDAGDFTTQLAGGNFSIVEAALAARQGLLSEGTVPYQYNGYSAGGTPWYSTPAEGADARTRDWSVNSTLRTVNDLGWYVSQIVELPCPAQTDYDAGAGVTRYAGYDTEATAAIKQALVDVGAVAISLAAETSLPDEARSTSHFDYNTWAQYDASGDVFTNHAVSIVGWDDDFAASNFSGTASGQPPAAGAWLCKNNWGSDGLYAALGGTDDATHWGLADAAAGGAASGFFWLSYYDHTITAPVAFEVRPTDAATDHLYQHDYLGMSEYSEPASYLDVLRVANVFTAESTELLTSVTAQTFREDETVTCWVYTLPMGYDPADAGVVGAGFGEVVDDGVIDASEAGEGADPAAQSVILNQQVGIDPTDAGPTGNGTLAGGAERTFEYAGFHEVELDHPVLVAAGQSFAVVEHVQANVPLDGTGDAENAAEDAIASYLNLELAFTQAPAGEPAETMAQVVANPGETFVSLQAGSWMPLEDFNAWYAAAQDGTPDMTFGNALIKAHTNDTSMGSGTQVYELAKL